MEYCVFVVTGFSKGYAFVEYKKKKDALYAARVVLYLTSYTV